MQTHQAPVRRAQQLARWSQYSSYRPAPLHYPKVGDRQVATQPSSGRSRWGSRLNPSGKRQVWSTFWRMVSSLCHSSCRGAVSKHLFIRTACVYAPVHCIHLTSPPLASAHLASLGRNGHRRNAHAHSRYSAKQALPPATQKRKSGFTAAAHPISKARVGESRAELQSSRSFNCIFVLRGERPQISRPGALCVDPYLDRPRDGRRGSTGLSQLLTPRPVL